jgi:hypothetical protein
MQEVNANYFYSTVELVRERLLSLSQREPPRLRAALNATTARWFDTVVLFKEVDFDKGFCPR